MAGSMREKQAGTWELRAFAGRDPLTGKARQVSRTFHGGKRGASKELANLVAETAQTRAVASTASFSHLLDRWLTEVGRLWSATYRRTAAGAVDYRIRPVLGHVKISELTARHLDDFYGHLANQGLADSTIRTTHGYIQAALSLAVRWDWIPYSPADKASPPQANNRTNTTPDVAQIRTLLALAAHANPDLATMLFCAATTGMRRGELCGLRWSDVDLEHGNLIVARSVVYTRPGIAIKSPKSGKPRQLAIDDDTCNILAHHHAACTDRWPVGPDGYVWSYRPGNTAPIIPNTLTAFFMRIRDKAGLPHVRLHDIRHFSVTTLLTANVDVNTVSRRHGHASGMMTLNRYGAFVPAADANAAAIIGQLLAAPKV